MSALLGRHAIHQVPRKERPCKAALFILTVCSLLLPPEDLCFVLAVTSSDLHLRPTVPNLHALAKPGLSMMPRRCDHVPVYRHSERPVYRDTHKGPVGRFLASRHPVHRFSGVPVSRSCEHGGPSSSETAINWSDTGFRTISGVPVYLYTGEPVHRCAGSHAKKAARECEEATLGLAGVPVHRYTGLHECDPR